ncbi:MAG: DNA polymerase III subunit delta' C-terminal domain-containing protein, partial [Gammaproteobacteria bacterium]
VFILLSDRPSRLLPTVRSRCQALRLGLPDPGQVLDWLMQRGHEREAAERALLLGYGAPLTAAGLLEHDGLASRDAVLLDLVALAAGRSGPLDVAANWQALGAEWSLRWLASLVNDMARLVLGATPDLLLHREHGAALQECMSGLDSQRVLAMASAVEHTARARAQRTGFNEPLMLEALAIDLHRCVSAGVRIGV